MEEESLSLKDKFFRTVFGVILFILVVMLAITFLPGDAERGVLEMLSGRANTTAGKVGSITIPISYYQRARRECYYRYKDYLSALKNDNSILDNCAFSNIKNLKIASIVANSIGYDVSEQSIKQDLSEEARRIHKESKVSAGYSKEEIRSEDEIFRSILKEEDLTYRKELTVARNLFENFLVTKIKQPESIDSLEKASNTLKLSLNYITFSDEEIIKTLDSEIKVSEEEVKKTYDSEVKEGKTPKDDKGQPESFEKRKSFLENKIKSEQKQKKLEEMKTKIESLKSTPDGLKEISKLTGKKVESIKSLPLSSLEQGQLNEKEALPSFAGSTKFMQDLSEHGFGKNFIGGPYKDSTVNTTYVEFTDLVVDEKVVPGKKEVEQDPRFTQFLQFTFLGEINQSIGGLYPVSKYITKQAN